MTDGKTVDRSSVAHDGEGDVLDLFRQLEAPELEDSDVLQMRDSVLELTRLADRGLLAESSGAWPIDRPQMQSSHWRALVATAAGVLLVALVVLRFPLASDSPAAGGVEVAARASTQNVAGIQSPAGLDPERASRAFVPGAPVEASSARLYSSEYSSESSSESSSDLSDAARATAIEDVREMLDLLPLVDEIAPAGAARVVYHQDDLDVVMLLGRGPQFQPSGGR